ncbi:hypothetical protein QFC21_002722, partial [Naganishia friedmannii]
KQDISVFNEAAKLRTHEILPQDIDISAEPSSIEHETTMLSSLLSDDMELEMKEDIMTLYSDGKIQCSSLRLIDATIGTIN